MACKALPLPMQQACITLGLAPPPAACLDRTLRTLHSQPPRMRTWRQGDVDGAAAVPRHKLARTRRH